MCPHVPLKNISTSVQWAWIPASFHSLFSLYFLYSALHRMFSGKVLHQGVSELLQSRAAPSKFGSSEEFIDLAAKDLICLPLGGVSDDRTLAFYPLRVAASLRRRDRVLIRPHFLVCSLLSHPHLSGLLLRVGSCDQHWK